MNRVPFSGRVDAVKYHPGKFFSANLDKASAEMTSSYRLGTDTANDGAEDVVQEVLLTVPASFDAVARELTVLAAAKAGMPGIILLEEPQAAFDFHGSTGPDLAGAGRRLGRRRRFGFGGRFRGFVTALLPGGGADRAGGRQNRCGAFPA